MPVFSHPKPDTPTSIMTDASDIAVGAVLQQYIANDRCPISYFSKKLKPAESRYSTFDRELLAVYLSIKHFWHFVEGCTFHILTDHKPLTYAFSSRPDRHTPRQLSTSPWFLFLSLLQISGMPMVLTTLQQMHCHGLERMHYMRTIPQLSTSKRWQQFNRRTLNFSNSSLRLPSLILKAVALPTSDTTIVCDTSTGVSRPFVPVKFCHTLFNSLHSLSHPGIWASHSLLQKAPVCPVD